MTRGLLPSARERASGVKMLAPCSLLIMVLNKGNFPTTGQQWLGTQAVTAELVAY